MVSLGLCPGPGAEGPLVLLRAEGRGFARHEMRSGGGTRGQGLREQGLSGVRKSCCQDRRAYPGPMGQVALGKAEWL